MTIAFWCVLVAGFLPYFGTLTAKIGGERFDNSNPRDWLSAQSGFRKRANAAQHNSFEAFPFFAAAVIIAHIAGAPQGRINLFAVVFVLARLFYIAFYVADMATLRSLAWFVGLGSVVALFLAVA
jgi:uncharacterized MAPEG superfamily protein